MDYEFTLHMGLKDIDCLATFNKRTDLVFVTKLTIQEKNTGFYGTSMIANILPKEMIYQLSDEYPVINIYKIPRSK